MHIKSVTVLAACILAAQSTLAQNENCNPTLKDPKPRNLHCGELGRLRKPALLFSQSSRNIQQCERICLGTGSCQSFGFSKAKKSCNFYSKPLIKQGYVQRTVDKGYTYYAIDCFDNGCPTSPPTGPPAGPCDVLVPPPGDFVTNGGFEGPQQCGIKPWEAYPRDNTTTYDLRGPAFEGIYAFATSANATYEFAATTDVALYQYLYLIPGTRYTLSFERKYTGDARTFVFIDYTYLFQTFGASDDYVKDSASFVATQARTTLQFSLRYASANSAFLLDNVSVVETVPDTPAVPARR